MDEGDEMMIAYKGVAIVVGRQPVPKDAEFMALVHHLGCKHRKAGSPNSAK